MLKGFGYDTAGRVIALRHARNVTPLLCVLRSGDAEHEPRWEKQPRT